MKRMIPVREALDLVLAAVQPLPAEQVPLAAAYGRVLAEDLRADRDVPPFDRAMMDGYAVRLADAGRAVPVRGELPAGQVQAEPLADGLCIEIMTGAPCPAGVEAVVPREEIRHEGDHIRLPEALLRGQHIAPLGSEARQGAVIVAADSLVTPLVVGNLAAFGYATVALRRRPRLALLTTGDEIAPAGQAPGPGQIRNSNGPMLLALAQELGCEPPLSLHAGDSFESLAATLEEAARAADVIVLTGGVSAGRYDLVPAALERLGATPVFHKVQQRPGKPLFFATRGPQLFFGLPGTPLGSLNSFVRYVGPALRKLMGQDPAPCRGRARLSAALPAGGERDLFLPARVDPGSQGLELHPLWGEGSSDLHAVALSNAFVAVPMGAAARAPGTTVDFEWMRWAPELVGSRPAPAAALGPAAPAAGPRWVVLTLSDKGARGERVDTSGPLVADLLRAALGGEELAREILPDEQALLESRLRALADDAHCDLIVTTGGTGFAHRDRSPEATAAVIDRAVPGLAEAMRAAGLAHTPHAMLSRGVCGLRGGTLIVNLSGSPKAAREQLEVILPALPHALGTLSGSHRECARQD